MKYQNNSRMEERASSVNIFADYGWHFLKSGTVWFHRATDGTASITFTCSRRLFNIASSSMFTRCFVISDGGTVKHVNESISRRGRAACHMIHGGKKVWKQNEREQKKWAQWGARVNKRQRGAASFFFPPQNFLIGFQASVAISMLVTWEHKELIGLRGESDVALKGKGRIYLNIRSSSSSSSSRWKCGFTKCLSIAFCCYSYSTVLFWLCDFQTRWVYRA